MNTANYTPDVTEQESLPTIGDVAAWAEVSPTLVRRILTGYRATTGDTTERAVWAAVEGLNYRPKPGTQTHQHMLFTGRLGPVQVTLGGSTYRHKPGVGWLNEHDEPPTPGVVRQLHDAALGRKRS